MKRWSILILIALLVFLPACRLAPAVSPAPTSSPRPATAATSTAPPEATASPVAQVTGTPTTAAPALFDIDPADRSVFLSGLTASAREAAELPGAPVYHMAFTLDESLTALNGRQTVTYTNLEDVELSEIYFHLHPVTLEGAIAVSDVTVNGAPVAAETTDAILRVPLPAPLMPGQTTTIDMTFDTTIPIDIGRNYGVLAYHDDILALAHFYPMLAVFDDEGWNITAPDIQGDLTYSDAAFYLVRVTAPDDVVLVGTGSIIEESRAEGTQTVTFATGPARDFYLAAGDFVETSRTVGETTIRSYAPAALADGAAAALDVAAAALSSLSERVVPYPYTELDIVTTPTSALGIEYPGLIVGTLNMYDMGAETAGGTPYSAILESTTAHEVGHQWFYNLVGNDQLDEPWLDESLASYSTYRYFVDQYGQTVGDSYFETFYGRWDRAGRENIPVGMPVANYQDAEYGAIVYGRGTIFVRELEEAMGREAFDAFLRDYVRTFTWEEGTTEEFRALAEANCECDLGPLFSEWIYK